MNYLNDKEVEGVARHSLQFYKKDDREQMFIHGVRWREIRDRCRTLPHVAEVVKCGQVNILYKEIAEKRIKVKEKPCDHQRLHPREGNRSGFSCMNCGEWVNYTKE